MSNDPVIVARPQRWDEPFGAQMTDALACALLETAPFSAMEPAAFPAKTPLLGILRNDTRIIRYQAGDLVVREGEYGGSAFLVLDGRFRVALERLPASMLGHKEKPSAGGRLWRSIAQLWQGARPPEARKQVMRLSFDDPGVLARPGGDGAPRVFLQDVPVVLSQTATATVGAGEVFGELSALARTPRTSTIFAEGAGALLEIRWQGLRELMRYAPQLREHIDRLYRSRALGVHLHDTPLLEDLPPETLDGLTEAVVFESYGQFEWHAESPADLSDDLFTRALREPMAREEGDQPDGLLLVRSGFARVSRRVGEGRRTVGYLGKGEVFGLAELAAAAIGRPTPFAHSLGAIGHLDLLRIPREAALRSVLAALPRARLEALAAGVLEPEGEDRQEGPKLSTGRLDFLVDYRLNNGVQAMVIDLDRCTRCDDCVRACAAAHDGNPRFVRQGPTHDGLQFASACMHCADPVCMIGCPTGAIHRDAATGVVRINEPTCVGCGTCAGSCPYQNIRMVQIRTLAGQPVVDGQNELPILKATKCDLCIDLVGGPACQQSCAHDALVRINLTSPDQLARWAS
ncbi:Electron transport protein HydN [Pirellulimonas nuda]|uniref:Electron transport protein HydN n=1 Tax=Pirellulimonas nuda TaxID=2528009 RepID=A0A518D723_9BACT|nr:cyclic nucleotide-binding domain-containing protein [Pirellulimonas nuda]QDU87283.1 Electron transport protein HydN [Pirellulimonas nuda]